MNKKIKFAEVGVGEVARKHLNECIDNNWVTNGSKVKELETKFAQLFGYKYVVGVNSGTTADLLAALSLYDIAGAVPRDSEIIVPALGFISAINAFWMANFNLKFCDVDKNTLNIDTYQIEKLITSKTKAILAINTMGRPCDMYRLKEICEKYKLKLISDNCEGHLCSFQKKSMGYWADMVTYSGYSAHLVFATEFGWIGTNKKEVYESVLANRSHGRPANSLLFEHKSIGWNGKPTDLHASIGLESIATTEKVFKIRTENLEYLRNGLDKVSSKFFISPKNNTDMICCPHALSLTFIDDDESNFNRFFGYLEEKGIECKLNFKSIPTQQKAYTRFNYGNYKLGDFPNAEHIGRNGLHIPCHQFLSKSDLDYIIDSIIGYFK